MTRGSASSTPGICLIEAYFRCVIYLLTSVLLSTGIFVLFQLFKRWNVQTFQAIVINYGVAAVLGWNLSGGSALLTNVQQESWVWIALCMGLLFIYLFQLIARATQEIGLTVTSIASKLSMVLPVALFLAFDPQDTLNAQKGAAILLAVPAIVLSSWKGRERNTSAGSSRWLIPLVIFVGSGMIDLMFAAYSGEEYMLTASHRYLFASLPLTTACLAGMVWLALSGQAKRPSGPTLGAGVLLGIINFGSLYFLLETYNKVDLARSGVMPLNNLGVILASAGASVWLLQERLNRKNKLGLALGTAVVVLLLWEALAA